MQRKRTTREKHYTANHTLIPFLLLFLNGTVTTVWSCSTTSPRPRKPRPTCVVTVGFSERSKQPLVTPDKDENFVSYSCNIDRSSLTTYVTNADMLPEIPKDIPSNVTQVLLSNKCLKEVPADAFKHLQLCEKLDLSYNRIKDVSEHAFRGLVQLKCLDLKRNIIRFLAPKTFSTLTSLEILYLSSNEISSVRTSLLSELKSLKIIKIDMNRLSLFGIEIGVFDGLSTLVHLDLSRNKLDKISKLRPINFQSLGALRSLELQNSPLKEIEPGSFDSLKKLEFLNLNSDFSFKGGKPIFMKLTGLKHLFLSKSKISLQNGTFSNFTKLIELDLSSILLKELHRNLFEGLVSLQKLNLSDNNIEVISSEHFVHLKPLTELDLSSNSKFAWWNEVKIQNGTFLHLSHLKKLYLSRNKLRKITKSLLQGLHSLELLDLNYNRISYIEPGAFINIVLNNGAILLPSKLVTGWNLFIDNNWLNKSQVIKTKSWTIVTAFSFDVHGSYGSNAFVSRNFCWMKQAEKNGWLHVQCTSKSKKKSCSFQPLQCPKKDKCMDYNKYTEVKCQKACKEGSLSEVKRDYEVCLFEYWCKCTCPEFEENSCEPQCADKGQFPATRITESGCKTCSCVCPKVNCGNECFNYQYEIINNTFGCPQCSCICPKNKCDEKCNGTGLGIQGPLDKAGCSTTCAGCLALHSNDTTTDEHADSENTGNRTLVLVAVVLVFLFAVGLFAILLRRKYMVEEHGVNEENKSELNYLLSKLNEDLGKQVEECWIDSINLKIGHLLGNGNFGIVWSGRLSDGPVKETEVAIKKIKKTYKDGYEGKLQLKGGNDFDIFVDKIRVEVEMENKKIEEFLQEAIIMRKFNHPNVLSLTGISTHGDRPCAILPLMTNGDLKKYLSKNQNNLSLKDLLAFSLGVAKGMEHIAEQQFVHRDLAARNCMLDSDLRIKIADFGLTRSWHDQDCYRVEDKGRALPIRWMSLEALADGVFTLKNDVWSFGVLLWEIFSFGEHPYIGIENEDILHYLKKGNRLPMPKQCPDIIYEMMMECWGENPEKRPTFTNLRVSLNDFADSEAEYMKMEDVS